MKKNYIPHVSIIILNWNGWKDTIECLESLYQNNYPNYDVILVDNCSTNNSIDRIKEYCKGYVEINSEYIKYSKKNKPLKMLEFKNSDLKNKFGFENKSEFLKLSSNKKIVLIINDKNYYFAAGNNIGIKYVCYNLNSDFFFLLNNDTLIENNLILELIQSVENYPNIGIAGPKICNYYSPHKNQWKKLQNIIDPFEDEFVSGAAFLIKKDVIKTIGLFDPRYINISEDKDYCYRARKAGFQVLYFPTKSKVLHKISRESGKIFGYNAYFKTRNIFLFEKKNRSNLKFLFFLSRFIIITFVRELKRNPKEKKFIVKGVKDGIFLILRDKSLLFRK